MYKKTCKTCFRCIFLHVTKKKCKTVFTRKAITCKGHVKQSLHVFFFTCKQMFTCKICFSCKKWFTCKTIHVKQFFTCIFLHVANSKQQIAMPSFVVMLMPTIVVILLTTLAVMCPHSYSY